MNVDLPEPFWPRTQWTSPVVSSRVTSLSATWPGKVFDRCSTCSDVVVAVVKAAPLGVSSSGCAGADARSDGQRPPLRARFSAQAPQLLELSLVVGHQREVAAGGGDVVLA